MIPKTYHFKIQLNSETGDDPNDINMSNLKTFFDRLIEEKEELGERLQKLKTYLDNGAPNASEKQKNWLKNQVEAMQYYYDVLTCRISDLESEGHSSTPASTIETYGMKAVGLSFNPGKNPEVEKVKQDYAGIIDHMNDLRANSSSSEQKRLASLAISEAQGAQMWAVKAITWKD